MSDLILPQSSLLEGASDSLKIEILKSLLAEHGALHSVDAILSWFSGLKTATELEVVRCNVGDLENWDVREWEIAHVEDRFFRVIGVEATIGNREVRTWCQPLIQQRQVGLVGFVLRRINGILHLLVQAKLEAGNFDLLEMAPTVQCITGSYEHPDWEIPYLDLFVGSSIRVTHHDTLQSEEGGRFYLEENRHMVVEVDASFPVTVAPQYIWMTFRQAKEFIRYNNYFNIEARSLLACVSTV